KRTKEPVFIDGANFLTHVDSIPQPNGGSKSTLYRGWHRLSAAGMLLRQTNLYGRMSVRRSRARRMRFASCACAAPTIGRAACIPIVTHIRPTVGATPLLAQRA